MSPPPASSPAATAEASRRLPAVGESLTAREREILHRLQGHQTLREIAGDLWVSYNTVKTITGSVYRKLGAHSRSQAVTIARQNTGIDHQPLTATHGLHSPDADRRTSRLERT